MDRLLRCIRRRCSLRCRVGTNKDGAERIEKLWNSISNVSRFIEKAKRYTEIPKLTSELLHLFIERVEVGERGERHSRTAAQKIIIRYRDIGILGAFAEEAHKIAV